MSVPAPRNHLVDLARVCSMGIVVTFHTLLYTIVVRPALAIVPWGPGPVLWGLSWLLAIIPVFFVAAGYADAVVVDRTRGTYADYLAARAGRLIGPLTLFGVVFTAASTIPAWCGFLPDAQALSPRFAQLLWFLVVYLGLLVASPFLVAAHDRFGGWAMLPFLVAAVAVDIAARMSGYWDLHWLNLAFAWPLAHQWGIAYHRGWFRRWPAGVLVALVAGCAAVIAAMVFWLGYPPSAVAWADELVANLQPPTVAVVVMGFGQTCLLGLLERCGVAARLSRRAQNVVGAANAVVLSAYLWHIPVIALAGGLLAGVAWLWPAATAIALNGGVWVVLTWVLVVLIIPRIARAERHLTPPIRAEVPAGRTIVSFAVLASGVVAAWQWGMVLHPAAPWSCVAVMLWCFGLAWFRRAVRDQASHASAAARKH